MSKFIFQNACAVGGRLKVIKGVEPSHRALIYFQNPTPNMTSRVNLELTIHKAKSIEDFTIHR